MTIFLKGVQLVYWAKFTPTVSYNGNIIEKIHKIKLETTFNVTERERFATFAISIVDILCLLHAS